MIRNGYPMSLLNSCIERFLNNVFRPKIPTLGCAPKTVTIVLPFVGKLSLDVRSRIQKMMTSVYPQIKCRVVFKTVTRVSNYFQYKDRIPLSMSSGVVYLFTCGTCNGTYVGKTCRHFHTRVSEHRGISDRTGEIRKIPENAKTAIHSHRKICPHDVTFDDFSVLARSDSDYLLKLKESLFINRDHPIINAQGKVKNLSLVLF